MNKSWRGALLVTVATGLALVLAGCARSDPVADSSPAGSAPIGAECRALLKRESPDLEARAAELLDTERNLLEAYADCDSGDWPWVWDGVQAGRPVIQRMQVLGTAEEVRDTECLKHLARSECDRVWRYTPSSGERTYTVILPHKGSGEFAISVEQVAVLAGS